MKNLKSIIFLFFFTFSIIGNTQVINKIPKKVTQKNVERKANDAVDKVLNDDNKASTNIPEKNNNKTQIIPSSDFVTGTKVVFEDSFNNDAPGDFPINWFTNSSGEIVLFNNDSKKWLQLSDKGSFSPLNISKLPENFTFEFDVTTTENFNFYSTPLHIVFTEKKTKIDHVWNTTLKRNEAVIINVHPSNSLSGTGRSEVFVISEKKEILKNKVDVPTFSKNNNTVRVQLWRQKNRLRMYVNGNKFWDLPTAFQEANYNQIIFFIGTYKKPTDKFFISQLKLAEAGGDQRHKLIETGSFTTNDILFDTNKATIQPSSKKVLDALGQALMDNSTVKISISGHTDSDGNENDNQKLSQKRADAVANYFSENFGISKLRLQTAGKGELEPITNNNTEDGKKQNRRVEFKVVK